MYANVQRLFEVQVDVTEVRLVWKHTGEVFLQLDTEAAQGLQLTQDEWVEWVLSRYGDLVAEELASWVADILPE